MASEYSFSVENKAGTITFSEPGFSYENGGTRQNNAPVEPMPPTSRPPASSAYGSGYASSMRSPTEAANDKKQLDAGEISTWEYEYRRITGWSGLNEALAVVGVGFAAFALWRGAK